MKYNSILSKNYGSTYKLFDNKYDDLKGNIDALENIQYECDSDACKTWKDCELLKKYAFYLYIKKDIKRGHEDYKTAKDYYKYILDELHKISSNITSIKSIIQQPTRYAIFLFNSYRHSFTLQTFR